MLLGTTLEYMSSSVEPTRASLLLAQIIRDETMRKGWTIRQLEQATDKSHDAMMRLLRGAPNVGPAVLRPVERELGLPTPFLSYVRDEDIDRIVKLSGLRADLRDRVINELGGKPRNNRRKTDRAS